METNKVLTAEEILQYNKRCAEFLGKEYDGNRIVSPYTHFSGQNPSGKVWGECKSHSDWNWIMEVVEAIEKKGYEIDIFSNCVEICDTPNENYITEAVGKTKKEAVVQAINQFLIWYEQNKTT